MMGVEDEDGLGVTTVVRDDGCGGGGKVGIGDEDGLGVTKVVRDDGCGGVGKVGFDDRGLRGDEVKERNLLIQLGV